MMLAAFVLAAAIAPAQDPPAVQEPAPPPQAAAAPAGGSQEYIDAGLKAFKRRRFAAAQAEFQKAVDAEPNSAAANFYLGYTYYKIAEPTRRAVAGKKKAAELFAKAFELDPAFKPVWGSHHG